MLLHKHSPQSGNGVHEATSSVRTAARGDAGGAPQETLDLVPHPTPSAEDEGM
jgi:hypothetical protein